MNVYFDFFHLSTIVLVICECNVSEVPEMQTMLNENGQLQPENIRFK